MDKILLSGMEFYGYHGVFQEEKKLGQRYIVDVELHTDLKAAGKSDQITDSIDYGEVFQEVKKIVEGEPKDLIEAVAESIAERLLTRYTKLTACLIKVTKPNPPIAGNYQSVAVQIYRERK